MAYFDHIESQEMYLKAIFVLRKTNPNIRAVDVCEQLGYSKSSVSRALKMLKKDGYITITDNLISFTPKGYEIAKHTNEHYEVFTKMFENLGICEDESREIACKLEHIVPESTFMKIKKALQEHRKFEHGEDF